MKKSNGLLKQFTVIGAGTFINLILGLISTPIITRIVEPHEYGQLSIFTMYSNIAVMVLCLGLDQATIRFYYEDDSHNYKQALLFRCLITPLIVTVAASAVFIFLTETKIIPFEFNLLITISLCMYSMIMIVYRFSQLIVRLEHKAKMYSFLQILQKIVYIVLALSLCLTIKTGYLFLLVIATIGSSLVCMIVSIIAQKDMWNPKTYNKENCGVSQKELLKYALPFILSMGVTTIFQAIDKFSLNIFCTYTEVGIYSSTMTLVHVFAVIQTAFNTIWSPTSVEHYTKHPEDTKYHQHANQVITVVMFSLGICLILFKDVFAIFLGHKYRDAAYILPFLIFNPIMYTISETTVAGLVFKKKSHMQVVVAVGACVTNIIGNTILVPIYGCQGAAISTGCSYIVFYLLRTLLGMKYYYVDFKVPKFLILTAVVSLYALYNTFIKFNIWAIVGFAVCVAVLLALYRKTVVWIFRYGLNLVKDFFKKKKKTA